MKIAIEATLAGDAHPTGLSRVAVSLIEALARMNTDDEFFLLYANSRYNGPVPDERFKPVSYAFGKRSLGLFFRLNPVLRKIGADVFHAPCNTGVPFRPVCPSLASVHDVFSMDFPGQCRFSYRLFFNLLIKLVISGSSAVHTDTRFTAGRIRHHFKNVPEIFTYPLAPFADSPAKDNDSSKKANIVKKVLAVGGLEPRKGYDVLAKAWPMAVDKTGKDIELKIVGPRRNLGADVIRELEKCATIMDFVSDEELARLYRESDLLVMPSLYEGFGLPVLEAMAAGTPVVCSDAPSVAEVAGDASLICRAGDSRELADALVRVLTDEELSRSLVEKGLSRARQFSWDIFARDIYGLYLFLAGQGPKPESRIF